MSAEPVEAAKECETEPVEAAPIVGQGLHRQNHLPRAIAEIAEALEMVLEIALEIALEVALQADAGDQQLWEELAA